jgi:hypothetical protein
MLEIDFLTAKHELESRNIWQRLERGASPCVA